MTSYTQGDSFPVLPVPNLSDPVHTYGESFGDAFHAPTVRELLFKTEGYGQRGVVLAAGQGVLATGTVLGQFTSGPNQYQYGKYASGNSDGTQVPLGFLRNAVDTTSGVQAGLLVDRGVVNYAVTSGLDSNAITLLGGRVDNAVGAFHFA
jgi:hypothetical protein